LIFSEEDVTEKLIFEVIIIGVHIGVYQP